MTQPEPDDILIDGNRYATAVAVCCREWVIVVGVPLRRCGYCGQVPVVRGPGDAT